MDLLCNQLIIPWFIYVYLIVGQLNEGRLFRGWGGDLMREAMTCLIKKLSLARLPFHGAPVLGECQ